MNNLLQLKYAVEVEKTGSISKAAENLYMNQPNLSKSIRELEDDIGIAIFDRTAKGVVPTEKGREFLGYARSILAQVAEMEALYKPTDDRKIRFAVCAPRASYVSHALTDLIHALGPDADFGIEPLGGLEGRDGHRVGFLPGGAAGAPEADSRPAPASPLADELRHDPGKGPEMTVLPEEACQVRREGIDHGDELVGPPAGLYVLVVGCEGLEVPLADPLAEPSLDEFLLPVVQVDSAVAVDQAADLLEFRIAQFQDHAAV